MKRELIRAAVACAVAVPAYYLFDFWTVLYIGAASTISYAYGLWDSGVTAGAERHRANGYVAVTPAGLRDLVGRYERAEAELNALRRRTP